VERQRERALLSSSAGSRLTMEPLICSAHSAAHLTAPARADYVRIQEREEREVEVERRGAAAASRSSWQRK